MSLNITLTDEERLAARKHLAPQLRKIGIDLLEDFEPHKLDWKELHERKKALHGICQSAVDMIKEGMSEEDARSVENAYEAVMQAYQLCTGELDIRAAIGNKSPRGHGGDPRSPLGADTPPTEERDRPARSNAWLDKHGEEIRTYAPNERLSEPRNEELSFGKVVRAMVMGPRNDAERRALSEGTDSAGGYTVPTPLASEFIDAMRAQSVAVQAGAITVPMQSDTLQIAKLVSDPAFAWRAENAEISLSNPTFSRVLFTARSCAALVTCSRELLEDSVNIEQILLQAFAQAAALQLDSAALIGTGLSDEPTGILNTSGINAVSMGTNGAAFANWDAWLDALYELELDNVPGPYTSVMHPRTARDLRKLKTGLSGDNTPLVMPQSVAEISRRISTELPIDETQGTATDASSVIVGNFSDLMIGVRSSLRIELLRERYASALQVGFLAHMRMDVQVRHPESFCVIQGVTPAA